MSSIRAAAALAVIASSASAQSSLAACGDVPDSTARQTIVSTATLKVCLLAMRADPADSTPRQWATRSLLVILETQQPGDFRRLAQDHATAWTVNGKPVAFDSTADSWERTVIDVLDAAWATKRLREMADDLRATDIDGGRSLAAPGHRRSRVLRGALAPARNPRPLRTTVSSSSLDRPPRLRR